MAEIKWYGIQAQAFIDKNVDQRLMKAGIYLQNELRKAVSQSQPTAGTGIHKRGLDPSAPGDYPKIVTGFFRRNINYEFDKVKQTVRVGTNVPYGRYLELGTSRMERRPWLSNGVRDFMPGVRAILETGNAPQ